MADHPLTDEICEEIAEDVLYYDYTIPTFRFDMRAAADWQLEQAIEWLKNCNMDHSLSYDGEYQSDRYLVVNAFREAMRPTTQEDN